MLERQNVCPVEKAGGLDFKLRRIFQNPTKILRNYISNEMTVVDIGCGPGFFSLDMAQLVGPNGKVICADLQQGMLDIIANKIENTLMQERIILHKCGNNKIGVTEKADFALAFFMVHEVPDKKLFFSEVKEMLKENGKILIVEPKYFHVSIKEFDESIKIAEECGLKSYDGPKVMLSQTKVLINH